jgi:hypothetical protein
MAYKKHTMKVWLLEDDQYQITGAHISVLSPLETRKDWKIFISQLSELLGDSPCPSGSTDGIYFLVETKKEADLDAQDHILTATRVFTDIEGGKFQASPPEGSIAAFSLYSMKESRIGSLAINSGNVATKQPETIFFGVPLTRAKGPVKIGSNIQKRLEAMGETLHASLDG